MKVLDTRALIIGIVGSPGSGKGVLVSALSEYLKSKAVYEGPFPEEIQRNFKDRSNFYETILWFREDQIRKFNQAIEDKENGISTVLDTFWITYQMHINPYLKNPEENKSAWKMAYIDRENLPWPDVTVYLHAGEKTMLRYMSLRDRTWEKNKEFLNLMAEVRAEYETFFYRGENKVPNLVIVDRDKESLDFKKHVDIEKVANIIKNKLVK